MADRPAPSWEAPEGCEFVAVPDLGLRWRLESGKRCRWTEGHPLHGCGKPSVAAINRSHTAGRENWWAYCPEHLYGRWISNGQVMCWILREKGSSDG